MLGRFSRLQSEQNILDYEKLPVKIHNMCGSQPYAEGTFYTKGGNCYTLRVLFGKFYPDEMPVLTVVSPKYLYTRAGKLLNDMGCTHAFHTDGKDNRGYLKICHTHRDDWSPSMTAAAVFLKGLTWVTAYEGHLKTGKSICRFGT